jgi:hypothetical protein
MRRQPLKVANASAGIAKLKVVMIDDITTRVPKNPLMTKNNTIETQRVDINNLIQDMIFLLLRTSNTLTIHSPFGNCGSGL